MVRPVLLVAAVLLGLAGCQTVPPIGPVVVGGDSAGLDTFAVDVANSTGTVVVIADRSVETPSVHATTIGRDGRTIPAPWAAADVVRAEPHPILRVLVSDRGAGARADVTVRVPAMAGLRVRNARGPVDVRGAAGAIDVQNGTSVTPGGDTTISLSSALDAPFMARTTTGTLRVSLPDHSKGKVRLTAGEGVVSFVARHQDVAAAEGSATDWSCVLNAGGHDVRLIAERGPVWLRVGN